MFNPLTRPVTNDGNNFHVPYPHLASRLFGPEKSVSHRLNLTEDGPIIFTERLDSGFTHSLSHIEIENLLRRVPIQDLVGIKWVLQLQPTRKESTLSPAWARYYSEIFIGKERGSALVLSAMIPGTTSFWGRSITPVDLEEIERLRNEGHKIKHDTRGYSITYSQTSIHATQQRSLLHEVGHHVDIMKDPEAFAKKTKPALEYFAHHYADRYLRD